MSERRGRKSKVRTTLARVRVECGLNQEEFAAMTGLSIKSLERYERGAALPEEQARIVGAVFGVSHTYLIKGDHRSMPTNPRGGKWAWHPPEHYSPKWSRKFTELILQWHIAKLQVVGTNAANTGLARLFSARLDEFARKLVAEFGIDEVENQRLVPILSEQLRLTESELLKIRMKEAEESEEVRTLNEGGELILHHKGKPALLVLVPPRIIRTSRDTDSEEERERRARKWKSELPPEYMAALEERARTLGVPLVFWYKSSLEPGDPLPGPTISEAMPSAPAPEGNRAMRSGKRG